eukprot:4134440-Pyramimonas_sp.AAC.1
MGPSRSVGNPKRREQESCQHYRGSANLCDCYRVVQNGKASLLSVLLAQLVAEPRGEAPGRRGRHG